MKKKQRLLIISIILIALLISIVILPGTFSAYRTNNSGNALLRASIWDVTVNANGANNQINLISGVTEYDYVLEVESGSEVDVAYKVLVNDLPSGVEVALDGGAYHAPTNGTVTFINAGTILYDDLSHTRTHTLSFKSNIGTTEATNLTINVDVEAMQNNNGAYKTATVTLTQRNNMEYDGTAKVANAATVTLEGGDVYSGTINYIYYPTNTCTTGGTTTAPIDAGIYYVKATVDAFGDYMQGISNCVSHVITAGTPLVSLTFVAKYSES